MRSLILSSVALLAASLGQSDAFSLNMVAENSSRRSFIKTAGSVVTASLAVSLAQRTEPANAAPTIYKTNSGIKYAITKDSDKGYPQMGDIVAIDYTGYLSNGVIFDATHAEGRGKELLFKLGSTAVIPGINEMVSEMRVGQKVQAIIPPELAFGDKGICLEGGECLVKPGSTLVYDIYLKKSSIPPP